MNKVVFAYSGGINGSLCLTWLRKHESYNIINLQLDLGGCHDSQSLCEAAIDLGAGRADLIDKREEFVNHYIMPALRANADFYNGGFLGNSLSRPIIVKQLVNIANEEKCNVIAHGSHLGSNDQIRFDACIAMLKPEAKIISPLEYINDQFIDQVTPEIKIARRRAGLNELSDYKINGNIWGMCVRGNSLDDTFAKLPNEYYSMTVDPLDAPNKERIIDIGFENGLPVSIDAVMMSPIDIVMELNKIGGEQGVGRYDTIDSGIFDLKTRRIVEAPAATILFKAHWSIEEITLDKKTLALQRDFGKYYKELIYNGHWFSPVREALDAFYERTQKNVCGIVRVRLYKGNCQIIGRRSPRSIYDAIQKASKGKMKHRSLAMDGFVEMSDLSLRAISMLNKNDD